jgi:acyl-CoA synthetase (AMP-forming)/AMP-acid ligase II
MKVPFNILDFLNRAEHVYGDRIGVVDEPSQPADSWGQLTWRQVAEHGGEMAAGLDPPGIGPGERVAIVSHNSALLVALSVDATRNWRRQHPRRPACVDQPWRKVQGYPPDLHAASKCRGRASLTIAS